MLAAALLSAQSALAQGCALCYNDAAATGPQGITALRHGILILAIPPMLIFSGLFGMLYHRRNATHEAPQAVLNSSPADVSSVYVLHLD